MGCVAVLVLSVVAAAALPDAAAPFVATTTAW
ncbi:hypothetical protein AB0O69_25805 [Streptomyces xiamenensis]